MKSKWKVTSQYIGGKKIYQVYRLIDKDAVDHSGNREYTRGIYYDRRSAVESADMLNGRGKE